MSSLEVLKHTRRIFSIVKGKTVNAKHKILEIFIEIIIIVFAITLSLYLERRREEQENHHLETKFLEGLKSDLATDLRELQGSHTKCAVMKNAALYFLKPVESINWSKDSVDHYAYELFHNVYFYPNSNRYESLKSTGKIGVISDEGLQGDIVDLYQSKIPDLQEQLTFFNDFLNRRVRDYLIGNFKRDNSNAVVFDKSFFTSIETRNILSFYGDLDDVQTRMEAAMETMKRINAHLSHAAE